MDEAKSVELIGKLVHSWITARIESDSMAGKSASMSSMVPTFLPWLVRLKCPGKRSVGSGGTLNADVRAAGKLKDYHWLSSPYPCSALVLSRRRS